MQPYKLNSLLDQYMDLISEIMGDDVIQSIFHKDLLFWISQVKSTHNHYSCQLINRQGGRVGSEGEQSRKLFLVCHAQNFRKFIDTIRAEVDVEQEFTDIFSEYIIYVYFIKTYLLITNSNEILDILTQFINVKIDLLDLLLSLRLLCEVGIVELSDGNSIMKATSELMEGSSIGRIIKRGFQNVESEFCLDIEKVLNNSV